MTRWNRLWLVPLLMLATGCWQKMGVQPSVRPQRPNDFFADGQGSRPPVPNTVARGQLASKLDTALYQGRDAKGELVSEFPYPVTKEMLKRGEVSYKAYCSMCHGMTGYGDGRIAKRGYTLPPSYHPDPEGKDPTIGQSRSYKLRGKDLLLIDVPVGHIYEVIVKGHGAMPSHGDIVPLHDRWAIVAYVRALQYSQSSLAREKLGKETTK
ncbi:MAG: cytochrome c [Gemmataceae bacterium]